MKQGMITTKCYRAILPNKATIGGQEKLRTLFDTFYTMHWSSPQHFCVSITFTFPYCVCSMMNLFIFSYPWAMLPDNIKKILNLRHGNADFQCDPGRTSQGASACPEEAPQLQPMQLHKQTSFPPLKSHAKFALRIQSDVKPFVCTQCNFSTKHANALKAHMITHLGGKSFTCTQCEFSCTRACNLKRHALTHGKESLSCTLCNYSCVRASHLKIHMRVHSGERPFACKQCVYTCKTVGDLKRHTQIHSEEKPFECGLCSYTTTQVGNLKRHKRKHTQEKPFKCGHCSISCSHSNSLQRHIKRKHIAPPNVWRNEKRGMELIDWIGKRLLSFGLNDDMTHCQMFQKVESVLPAKIWRLVGCTEMISW